MTMNPRSIGAALLLLALPACVSLGGPEMKMVKIVWIWRKEE